MKWTAEQIINAASRLIVVDDFDGDIKKMLLIFADLVARATVVSRNSCLNCPWCDWSTDPDGGDYAYGEYSCSNPDVKCDHNHHEQNPKPLKNCALLKNAQLVIMRPINEL